MAVQLDLDCLDDFGLTRCDLVYRRNDGESQRQTISRWSGSTREARVVFPWKLDEIARVPGDRITYHLELTDNDAVTGPKTTIGPDCEIRFPSLDEIYAQVEEDRKNQTSDFKQALETQRELRQDLQQIQNELKQSRGLRWEQQEQVKDLAARQQQVSDQIGDLAQSLERSLDRMQQTNLFTPEMVQKVQEINQIAAQIQSPEFREYLKKLQDALQKLDRNAVNKALENLKLTQEQIERNLDRTLEMLKQLQREESLDQLVNQAERMAEEQKRLNDQLGPDQPNAPDSTAAADSSAQAQNQPQEKKQKSDRQQGDKNQNGEKKDAGQKSDNRSSQAQEKLTPQQAEAMRKQQEALRAELAKMQKQLDSLAAQAAQKWQELKKQMESQQSQEQLNSAANNMKNASQSMGSGQKKSSLRFGRQAQKNLQNFAAGMRKAQSDMQGVDMEAVTRQLYRLSGQLVQLSRDQESLLQNGPEQTTRDLAEAEQRIEEGARATLDSLYNLGRNCRFITPQLGKVMGEAVRVLGQSKGSFGDGDRGGGMAAGSSGSAALDQTVLALLNANQNMCNSTCSSSCSNPLAQLRNISGQQESLNQSTQQMMQQLGSSPGSRTTARRGTRWSSSPRSRR